MVYSDTDGEMLGTGGYSLNRLHTHITYAGRCKYEVWLVTFLPLYNCYTVVNCGMLCCCFQFQFFVKLTVPPQAAGVVGTLNCWAFSLDNSDIQGTTVSFLGP